MRKFVTFRHLRSVGARGLLELLVQLERWQIVLQPFLIEQL